jgi:hypothetical protein
MRCVIEDKATPETGGVTNRAQKTTASSFKLATLAEGQSRFIGEPNFAPPRPKKTKRTQFAPCPPSHRPNYAKRTQFTPRPLPHRPKNAKRTQSPSRRTCGRPKNAKRTQFPHTKCPAAPYLCETNPISTRQKNETNPISTAADLWRTKKTKRTQFTVPPASRRQRDFGRWR